MLSSRAVLNHLELTLHDVQESERREFSFYIEGFEPIPWKTLLDRNELHKLEGLKIGYTCMRWAWLSTFRDWVLKLGCKGVFSTSYLQGQPFEVFTYPDYVKNDVFCGPKDLLFSFVGWENNFLRQRIFERYRGVLSVIKRDSFSVDKSNNALRTQYTDILSRSNYSLCPKGVGNGTIRFWESLAAGSIPVVISDRWEFPDFWDWKTTAIRIPEDQFLRNPLILDDYLNLSAYSLKEFQSNCVKCHDFISSDGNMKAYIKGKMA